MKKPVLKSVRTKNFKAITDSGKIKLGPLTVFIGNNGSGKSSLIEGLETFQAIAMLGIDKAFTPFHGFESVWNKTVRHRGRRVPTGYQRYCENPMEFQILGTGFIRSNEHSFQAQMQINSDPGFNTVFIQTEAFHAGKEYSVERDIDGSTSAQPPGLTDYKHDQGESIYSFLEPARLFKWQFLGLIPQKMGEPVPQARSRESAILERDGSNIGQYLNWIRETDIRAYDGIVEALRYVVSYASDIQPVITSEIERLVYLQMTEREFKIPGWLLSTGTLRILALLAVLRSPKPPPLLVVEEIENGLDPRTVNLVLEEIRTAAALGQTQVILSTHSPYVLDQLNLEDLVLCERDENRIPKFWRPGEDKSVQKWAESFAPGQLYIMERLQKGSAK